VPDEERGTLDPDLAAAWTVEMRNQVGVQPARHNQLDKKLKSDERLLVVVVMPGLVPGIHVF
jgi:hypothetical protein